MLSGIYLFKMVCYIGSGISYNIIVISLLYFMYRHFENIYLNPVIINQVNCKTQVSEFFIKKKPTYLWFEIDLIHSGSDLSKVFYYHLFTNNLSAA